MKKMDEYERISFWREEEDWICFIYSVFQKFVSFTKVNLSKMTIHCVDGVASLRTAILA